MCVRAAPVGAARWQHMAWWDASYASHATSSERHRGLAGWRLRASRTHLPGRPPLPAIHHQELTPTCSPRRSSAAHLRGLCPPPSSPSMAAPPTDRAVPTRHASPPLSGARTCARPSRQQPLAHQHGGDAGGSRPLGSCWSRLGWHDPRPGHPLVRLHGVSAGTRMNDTRGGEHGDTSTVSCLHNWQQCCCWAAGASADARYQGTGKTTGASNTVGGNATDRPAFAVGAASHMRSAGRLSPATLSTHPSHTLRSDPMGLRAPEPHCSGGPAQNNTCG